MRIALLFPQSGSNPHFSRTDYCGGEYIRPDCVMLLRPAVRSLLAKDGLLDVLYKYDCGGFISISINSRRPCQACLCAARRQASLPPRYVSS